MQNDSDNSINYYSIGFYNLENLFDTKNDPKTLDDDFTENSERNWNEDRFRKKIKKLGKVITELGYSEIRHPPAIIGVAEVENDYVLSQLVNSKHVKDKGYNYIHFDSPDERGIDTALLYREDYFKILYKEAIPLYVYNPEGERDYTRDILYVKGELENNTIHILVNHWPSRHAGYDQTEYKRKDAAKKNREIMATILSEEPDAKIIIMGDFNDNPSSESIQLLKNSTMYNPMDLLLTKDKGTEVYKGEWNLFVQILISNNFLKPHNNPLRYEKSNIYNPIKLQEYTGKYKGDPFRTYVGDKYLGGLSDHFPVFEIFSVRN